MWTFKQRIFNWALRKLFPIFNLENVLTTDKSGKSLYLNKELVESKKLANLQEQVRLLKNSDLWQVLTETLMYDAQQIMFNRSKDYQDLVNGKMVLYTIDVMNKMIEKIEKSR